MAKAAVRFILLWAAVLAALATSAALHARAAEAVRTDNVAAALVSEVRQVRPGERIWVALRFHIREGWHTYWRNPGDSGEPTQLEWTLPEGVVTSEIRWPYPERIPVGPLANYGYHGQVLHLVELSVPETWPQGRPVPLRAQARWLVCEQICIPEEGALALDLPTGAATVHDPDRSALFGAARARLPVESPWPARFVREDGALTLGLRMGADADRVEAARFFPYAWKVTEPAGEQRLTRHPEAIALAMSDGGAEGPIEGVLVLEEVGGAARAISLHADVGERPAWLAGAPLAMAPRADGGSGGLPHALLLALLGGVILNLMPCVFPVLSVKALSLAGHAHDRADARGGALAYAAGVLVFMAAIGGGLIALRRAGAEIGWGFQLQEPAFVAAMALVMFALGLWMSGLLTLGGRLIGAGQGLAMRPGLAGSFFTGALAALVATPCTAPFMGTAIGYALGQPWPAAMGVMLALGVGLALPYVALGFAPGAARLLPRAGPWMERLKQALAFPLYATAVWLVWVLARQTGPEGVAVTLGAMLLLGFAAWLKGATEAAPRWRTGGAVAAGLVAVAALALALATPAPEGARFAAPSGAGPVAEPYSEARLAALRAEGRPVFLNLTAAWCITCQVNERVALSSRRVAEAFAARGVVYLEGDWTNRDPAIARLLAAHGRSGVPLYLVFRPGAAEPAILPQLLTENIVLDSLSPIPVLAATARTEERRS